MNVSVERYQRRKYVSQENSPMLYYVRQKSGTVRVMDVEKLADAIEANSSLTAGDVKHAIEAFVEQLRLSLTQGDKVKAVPVVGRNCSIYAKAAPLSKTRM